MRARLVIILVAVVLVASFAALNWSEFTRTAPLSFWGTVSEASLGFTLLTLLAIALVAWLVSSGVQESRSLRDYGRHAKALDAQRDLADRAEASRFVDLRQHFDTHLREARQRESIFATELEKNVTQGHRDLRAQLDQMMQVLSARLRELEARIDARGGIGDTRATDVPHRPAGAGLPPNDRVKL